MLVVVGGGGHTRGHQTTSAGEKMECFFRDAKTVSFVPRQRGNRAMARDLHTPPTTRATPRHVLPSLPSTGENDERGAEAKLYPWKRL